MAAVNVLRRAHGIIAFASFTVAAVAAWWAVAVHHVAAAHVAVYGLAGIGALDLAECVGDLIRKLWQQNRR